MYVDEVGGYAGGRVSQARLASTDSPDKVCPTMIGQGVAM